MYLNREICFKSPMNFPYCGGSELMTSRQTFRAQVGECLPIPSPLCEIKASRQSV